MGTDINTTKSGLLNKFDQSSKQIEEARHQIQDLWNEGNYRLHMGEIKRYTDFLRQIARDAAITMDALEVFKEIALPEVTKEETHD